MTPIELAFENGRLAALHEVLAIIRELPNTSANSELLLTISRLSYPPCTITTATLAKSL